MSKFFRAVVLSISTLLMTTVVSAEENSQWRYTMQSGESIWDIAHELLTDWRDWKTIERINNVSNDRRMSPGTVLEIPRSLINEYDSSIQVLNVSGTVTAQVLLKDGTVKAHLPLAQDQVLSQGDEIKTAEQSTVLLGFDDGTEVLILENSTLRVDRATVVGNTRRVVDIKVFLDEGEAEIRANPGKVPGSQFLINTPVAFATTKGTVYRVRAKESTTAAEVTQGKIGVVNALGATDVKQGFGSIVEKDKAPSKPKKLLQAPQVPEFNEVVRYLPSKLQWQDVKGAVNYRAQISPDETFSTIVYDKISSQPKTGIPSTLLDQPYWLRVSAVSDEGLQGLTSKRQFNVNARPFPPVQQAPRRTDSLYVGEVKFEWSKPENVSAFILEVSLQDNFAQPSVHETSISKTQFATTIDQPGKYFWRVTSIAKDGEVGPLGFSGEFTVKPIPATPEPNAPTSSETELFFSWKPDQDAAKYQLQLAKDQDFTKLVVDESVKHAELAIPKPKPGTYYMRVRAFDKEDYAGEWSASQQVEQPIESWWPAILTGVGTVLLFL